MSNLDKFAVAINCIDGRVQAPVAEWLKLHAQVQYVDMITIPGADKVLANGAKTRTDMIADKLRVSIEAHHSKTVAIVGHHDCAANPVSFDEHKLDIEECVEKIREWGVKLRVIGLYVNEWNSIDVVYDSDSEFEEMKSFL